MVWLVIGPGELTMNTESSTGLKAIPYLLLKLGITTKSRDAHEIMRFYPSLSNS
jgi:hypothetical protein